ncbi:hypothetical protein TorRG33x02_061600 [Trema orientale]|uniref:Uncharacterized protein n=1 Tax=Trema orientale TaxID=63057 RepID=A0A2P5FK02_TREOI|nr:hypothetical protein TorRG33x02_061600 [Trema orientale]
MFCVLRIPFRKWLNEYGHGQVDWRGKFRGAFLPSPPRDQIMDK